MRAFLYDKYGYYPEDEYATSFDYNAWHFQVELTDKNDQELLEMKKFLDTIPHYFPSMGADIIKSRDGHYVTNSEYGPIALVATKNGKFSSRDLILFHRYFTFMASDKNLKISYLKSVWEHKSDRIEEKILPRLKIDDKTYALLMENCIHASGLAENAIQYLSDTIFYYGDNMNEATLAHKRVYDYSTFTFLNPMNMVIDSPVRDLADLIKYNLITEEELFRLIDLYSLTPSSASVLLARLLYPTDLYDMLEEYHLVKHDIASKTIIYYDSRREKMKKIKNIHDYLVNKYSIRPLSWLEV